MSLFLSSTCHSLNTDQTYIPESILFHLYSTDLSIQELALDCLPPTTTVDTIKQIESLQKCLSAVESLFRTWEGIPPHRLIGLTFSTFMHKIQGIVALFRLSTLDTIPAWSTVEVRKRLDIFALLDRLSALMESAATAIPVAEDDPGEDSRKFHFLAIRNGTCPSSIKLSSSFLPRFHAYHAMSWLDRVL